MELPCMHYHSFEAVVNMAEIAEDGMPSSENEATSGISGSTESIDLSCIHWGYLNCTLLNDAKKIKDYIWQTYWVDLCGSTLRLYKDLSLPANSSDKLPPSHLTGPTNENEKKEAFIILKKGAEVTMVDAGYEVSSSSPCYLFQAPSKGAMYRWMSKIEEGIDMADKPQNESATDKRLKEAKLLSMEQRRYHVVPEMGFHHSRDDVDSGMEGDVEEAYDASKKFPENPHLDILKKRLQEMEDLVVQLKKEEEAFLGPNDSKMIKRCEFKSTTSTDYFLVPGYPRSFIPKGTELTILGQMFNGRWRCFVELPKNKFTVLADGNHWETSSEVESISSFDISEEGAILNSSSKTETFIGSVPSSLLVELSLPSVSKLKYEDGTPIASPGDTPQLSPFPSPPHSPYSRHKSNRDSLPNNKRSSLRRSIASENLSEQDIWEQFCIPSPPSSPATSRSTTPSLSRSNSSGASLENVDFDHTNQHEKRYADANIGKEQMESENMENEEIGNKDYSQVALRRRKEDSEGRNALNVKSHREAILMNDDVPETYIGSDSEDDRMVTVIDEVPSHEAKEALRAVKETVKMRVKKNTPQREFGSLSSDVFQRPKSSGNAESPGGVRPNYAFLVTKKLRQRGISLIVGSSSSEEEDDDDTGPGYSSKLSLRRLDAEFTRYEKEEAEGGVRSHSAFVPMKRAAITLSPSTQEFNPRSSTTDELLRDYSSPADKLPSLRANTCTTIERLGAWSSTENAPPLNQRRTLQLSKPSSGGFGFTLQTYGIVQQGGEVDYMTFILSVEEDGPAYMAGLRPGDIILEVDGTNVEEEDHKTIVTHIHQASESVRLVVVFVDALRRMKMNTKLKLLQAELAVKERELEDLSKKEKDLLEGRGCTLNLSSLQQTRTRERTGSYLYTTELTSCFDKKSPDVHDSLLKYRQPVQDTRPRPCSMAEQSDYTKQHITATTGSEILKNFSSPDLSANRRKLTVSNKLIKSFRKKKPSMESFKSYVDLDLNSDDSGKDNLSAAVSEPALSVAEPSSAANTMLESKTFEQESLGTNGWSHCNGKSNSLPPGSVNISLTLQVPSEDSGASNQGRLSPEIPRMRRGQKKSPAKTLPMTSPNPKESSFDSNALQRPDLQRGRLSPQPEPYLLAVDEAGKRPLSPKERKQTTRSGIA